MYTVYVALRAPHIELAQEFSLVQKFSLAQVFSVRTTHKHTILVYFSI